MKSEEKKNVGSTKNHKAKNVAENMEITPKTKESLARFIIFATTLGDDFDELEAARTLSVVSKWKAKSTPELRNVSDLKKLYQDKWSEKQDLSDIISILVDILSDSDFFDIQEALINTLEQYGNDLKKANPLTSQEELNKIKFSNSDFARQFYGEDGNGGSREVTETEKYANLMYLSNQLSHVFKENPNSESLEIDKWEIKHVVQELWKIKNWCVHQLIAQKAKGARIDIANLIDDNIKSDNNGIISFYIPNYFEPFVVHYNPSMLSEEERKHCDGTDKFISSGIRTSFPQYLSNEKMRLLEKVYTDAYWCGSKVSNIRSRRLQCLFEARDRLDEEERATTEETISAEVEETQKTIELPQEKVAEIVAEIESLNQACITLTEFMQEISRKLQATQAKINELRGTLPENLDLSNSTDDKGDIGE